METVSRSTQAGDKGKCIMLTHRRGRDQRPDWSENWIEVASRLCSVDARSAVGLSGLSRVSKLKMLGNCNPPQMYYQIYKAIAEVCNGLVIR